MAADKIKIFGYDITLLENSENTIFVIVEKGDFKQAINLSEDDFNDLLHYLDFNARERIDKSYPKNIQMIPQWTKINDSEVSAVMHFSTHGSYYRSYGNPNPLEAMYIAIPQNKLSLNTIEKVQNACGELMEAMGFEMEQKEEPVFGSFFQKSWWKRKFGIVGNEIDDVYSQAKKALILQHQNLPNAEATEKLANAAANFLNSIKDVDTVAARFGALIVVKYNIESKTGLICETLSPDLTMFFESNPQLLSNPNAVFQLFENLKNNPNHFKEVSGPASADNVD